MNWSNWRVGFSSDGGGLGASEDNWASLGGKRSLLLALRYLVSVAAMTEMNVS